VARSHSADWLYTYLRTFYRDAKTVTGWNNAVFENVAMPHVLWTLQGERAYDRESRKWSEIARGTQSPAEYDATVRDLVNFLVYVGEPAATQRKVIGIVALFVLAILFVFTYLLKKEYWKDVK
jgi:ubiquinol-cytochrome c reductase cytochrome c1 subunit